MECIHCDSIPGFYLTSSFECLPICGDGTNVEPFEQCDDGNTFNGDGCSSLCEIEDGFNEDGVEIIRPQY